MILQLQCLLPFGYFLAPSSPFVAPLPILLLPWVLSLSHSSILAAALAEEAEEEEDGAPSRERCRLLQPLLPQFRFPAVNFTGALLVFAFAGVRDLDSADPETALALSGKRMDQTASSPTAAPVLVLSNSWKRKDSSEKRKKYVKQVTGRHNDTELHLAALRGDLAAVRQILSEIHAQVTGTDDGAELDAEVAEIRAAVVNEVNQVEETALFIAAEKGFLDVVVELLKYSDRECLSRKNRAGFDALHVAAREGHRGEQDA